MRIRGRQGGCATGEAVITTVGNLTSKYVIHTVGPVWNGGGNKEDALLRSCYHNSLKQAVDKGLLTIAFPNISTGIYHFPKKLAADIAIAAVRQFEEQSKLDKVYFVCFDEENYNLYQERLS